MAWLVYTINMYSNMKYYENICNCLRVIQQDINRKLKSANCWQRTSLSVMSQLKIDIIKTHRVLYKNERGIKAHFDLSMKIRPTYLLFSPFFIVNILDTSMSFHKRQWLFVRYRTNSLGG